MKNSNTTTYELHTNLGLKKSKDYYLNFGKVLYIGMGILMMFGAFGTSLFLSPKILKDNDFGYLGWYTMALFFLCQSIFSVISTSVVNYLDVRTSLVFSSLTYALHTVVYILPVYKA